MTGIYQVYTCHISSAVRFLAFRVPAARRVESDLDARRILSVFATETPAIRGWGLPKFRTYYSPSHISIIDTDIFTLTHIRQTYGCVYHVYTQCILSIYYIYDRIIQTYTMYMQYIYYVYYQ